MVIPKEELDLMASIHEEALHVPRIAQRILEDRYGIVKQGSTIKKQWARRNLESKKFQEVVDKQMRSIYKEGEKDPFEIARELGNRIPGYSVSGERIQAIMRDSPDMEPLQRPRYTGGSRRTTNSPTSAATAKRVGRRIKRGEYEQEFAPEVFS